MITNFMRVSGLLFLIFSLLGCQVVNGAGRVKLQDFYQDKNLIELAKAAANGNVQRIDQLVASGVNVNKTGNDGMTPLLWALLAKNKTGMKRLLEHGASPNTPLKSGDSIINFAAAIDDPDYLRMVLAHGGNPDYVNPQDNVNPTSLFIAISRMNEVNVQALIHAGADLNYKRAAGSETPMMAAAALNQWKIVYALLTAGTDYALKNRWGNTVTYYIENNNIVADTAQFQWRQEVIKFLENKGVTVSPKTPMQR